MAVNVIGQILGGIPSQICNGNSREQRREAASPAWALGYGDTPVHKPKAYPVGSRN